MVKKSCLDFSKAFYSVSNQLPNLKMEAFGTSEELSQWKKGFLGDGTFSATVRSENTAQ